MTAAAKYRLQGEVVEAVQYQPGLVPPDGFKWREANCTGATHTPACSGKPHAIIEDMLGTTEVCPGEWIVRHDDGHDLTDVLTPQAFKNRFSPVEG